MFKIGDLVTRKSYNNDVIFTIIDFNEDLYFLKGKYIRLYADSKEDDLVDAVDMDDFRVDSFRNLDRSNYFYLPGTILHIDADHLCNSEFEKVL